MTRSRRQRLALVVALSTALFLVPLPGLAADGARFAGRVYDTDGVTPRAGVVVALYDAGQHEIYRSRPTGDEGSFAIDEAPAGSYAVVAETDDGAYLASDRLDLQAGDNQPLALTLRTAPAQTAKEDTLEPWAKWTIAGSIAAVSLLAVIEVTGSDTERNASPEDFTIPEE